MPLFGLMAPLSYIRPGAEINYISPPDVYNETSDRIVMVNLRVHNYTTYQHIYQPKIVFFLAVFMIDFGIMIRIMITIR